MARLRCHGRFCFWQPPFGPWRCIVCHRPWEGPMPRNAEHRFWQAIDDLVAKIGPPRNDHLLDLFFKR